MLQSSTLKFLAQLEKNNDKSWFDTHRIDYDNARTDFAAFVQRIINKHAAEDESVAGIVGKNCMFRINRDVRFSKNKDPYKTNFGAVIHREGRKTPKPVYYIQLQPGNRSFAGGGIWMPETAVIKSIRQEIDYNTGEFLQIIKAPAFKKAFGDLDKDKEISLSRLPKGYESDHAAAEYLKLKCWVASAPITDEEWISKNAEKKILQAFTSLKPLMKFLNRAIDGS